MGLKALAVFAGLALLSPHSTAADVERDFIEVEMEDGEEPPSRSRPQGTYPIVVNQPRPGKARCEKVSGDAHIESDGTLPPPPAAPPKIAKAPGRP